MAAVPGGSGASPSSVTHEFDGARVVVRDSPFGLAFQDTSGRTVLEQVTPPLMQAMPSANLAPEPGGVDQLPEVAAYAPFAYEVGAEKGTQWPVLFWTGNMLAGVRGGVVHHATAVLETVEQDGTLAMTLSTTEPGRTLGVTISSDGPGALRVQVTPQPAAGVVAMGDAFSSGPDEAFHGFGGRHNTLDQHGNDFYAWVEEENFNQGPLKPLVDPIPDVGDEDYLFPNGPTAAYYVQNMFVSSRPYGFLANETALTRWRMAAERDDAWRLDVRRDGLDYTVAVGPAPEAIRAITAITGRQRVPPAWAMGPTLKRAVSGAYDYQTKVAEDLVEIERYMSEAGMPVEAYSYEGWDGLPEDFVRETNAWLTARDIRPIGYVRAFVSDDGTFDADGTFQDAVSRGLVAMTPGGAPWIGVAVGPAALLDFTNPDTVAWWEERKIRHMLDLGFDGFMQDFGEQVMEDMVFHNGETGVTMHNRFPVVFHQVTRSIVDRFETEHPERGPIFMYVRAGFTGRPGSAAYESSTFPGDEHPDWSRSNGIAALATDMLNRAIGGAVGFNTDIGGYLDSWSTDELDEELFTRWSQWSALTPFFRVHNSFSNGTKMPWSFDEPTLSRWIAAARLHMRARPYVLALWEQTADTGMPMQRPMWLAFPDDPEAAKQDQQWMLGEEVLVAPVVTKGATSRPVYFPAGCWQHGETGELYTGPGERAVAAPLESLPWFHRCDMPPPF
ncbi:MAG: TIM-barrel domain-containing protein [Actinomycetota bacterium]